MGGSGEQQVSGQRGRGGTCIYVGWREQGAQQAMGWDRHLGVDTGKGTGQARRARPAAQPTRRRPHPGGTHQGRMNCCSMGATSCGHT